MAESKITRELVQELAETGSVQPPLEVWGDLDPLYESMGELHHRKFSLRMSFDDFLETPKGKILLPVAKDIITIAGECDLTWDIAREMGYTLLEADCGWHPDPDTSLGGFSILFIKEPVKHERLITGGRGATRVRDDEKAYHYKNGPIVLAQEGFGHKLLDPVQSKLGVWHTGVRVNPSRFGVVDFIPV